MTTADVELAYRHCEAVTKREARNFAYGIRLLRPPERRALSAVYALARRIDDIGDGDTPAAAKVAALASVRKDLDAIDAINGSSDLVLVAVADAKRRYRLPMEAFGDLVDGCEMDVSGTTYRTADELVAYCRRVAGSIGRLSLAVFGATGAVAGDGTPATTIADDLGVALQLTNILRDVREDAARGRFYLPADDARSAGCPADLAGLTALLDAGPAGGLSPLEGLVALECDRAQTWFDKGLRLLGLLDHRSRACAGAMAGIYHRLLRRIAADPGAVAYRRVSVPTHEKLWVATTAMAGLPAVGRRPRPSIVPTIEGGA